MRGSITAANILYGRTEPRGVIKSDPKQLKNINLEQLNLHFYFEEFSGYCGTVGNGSWGIKSSLMPHCLEEHLGTRYFEHDPGCSIILELVQGLTTVKNSIIKHNVSFVQTTGHFTTVLEDSNDPEPLGAINKNKKDFIDWFYDDNLSWFWIDDEQFFMRDSILANTPNSQEIVAWLDFETF